jgi:hypothetical protein
LKPYFVPISSKTEFQVPVRQDIPTPNPCQVIPHIEDDPRNVENLARFPQIPAEQQYISANEKSQPPVIFQEVFDEFVPDDDFTIAQMPQRGRGRPRGITALTEQVQIQQPPPEILPKRGRGRLRKIISARNNQPPTVDPESTIP